mgnify:CR=1 FL=1
MWERKVLNLPRRQKATEFHGHTDHTEDGVDPDMKQFDNDYMIDVFHGPVNLRELSREIRHYIERSPERMVIEIWKYHNLQRYVSIIYLTKADFERGPLRRDDEFYRRVANGGPNGGDDGCQ